MQTSLTYKRGPIIWRLWVALIGTLIGAGVGITLIMFNIDQLVALAVTIVFLAPAGTLITLLVNVSRVGLNAAELNGKRNGILLSVGLFRRRTVLLPLEEVSLIQYPYGVRLNYAHQYILKDSGRIKISHGGTIIWKNASFENLRLQNFADNVIRLQKNVTQNPTKVKIKKSGARGAVVSFFSIFGIILLTTGVIELRNNVNTTTRSSKSEKKATSKSSAAVGHQAEVTNIADSVQQVDYQPGATIKTDQFEFKFNKGYLAWTSDNQRVVVFNITLTSLLPGDEGGYINGGNSFVTMDKWDLATARAGKYYDDDDFSDVKIAKNGKDVQVVNRLTNAYFVPYDAEKGYATTFNLLKSVPENTNSFDFYYEGFDMKDSTVPKDDDDSNFVMHVNTKELEQVNE
jgi:hypothetical protein